MTVGAESLGTVARLLTLSVTLIGYESNAQFVNPLTLLSNHVVDDSWVCQPGARIGLTQSNFTYTNGVHVEAFEANVTFRQHGDPIGLDDALVPEIASRYVGVFGAGNWMAVSFHFLAEIHLDAISGIVDPEVLLKLPNQLSRHGVQPRWSTEVFYYHSDKRLRVELSIDPTSKPSSLTCFGWTDWELNSVDEQAHSELQSALSSWESTWKEVVAIAAQLLDAFRVSENRNE